MSEDSAPTTMDRTVTKHVKNKIINISPNSKL